MEGRDEENQKVKKNEEDLELEGRGGARPSKTATNSQCLTGRSRKWKKFSGFP